MRTLFKVLIVDDEMLIRQGIINFLDWETEGYKIVGEASTGIDALEMIETYEPHIIITDIVMPVMDGIDLVKIVKEKFPDIEIIVLSSFEDYEYVRTTFQQGVADYILKPKLDRKELISILNRVSKNISLTTEKAPTESDLSVEERLKKLLVGYKASYNEEKLIQYFPHRNFYFLQISSRNKWLEWDPIITKIQQQFTDDIIVLPAIKEETHVTLVINCPSNQVTHVKQTIKELADPPSHIEKLTYVLSHSFTELEKIKLFYNDFQSKIKQFLFYFPDQSVLLFDEFRPQNKSEQNFDLNYFIEVFKDKQFNIAIPYITSYVDYLSTQYTRDSFEFKSFLGNIIFNIIVVMENLKYDTKDLDKKKYHYFSKINEALHVKEALELFEGFLREVKQLIFVDDYTGSPTDIQRLIQYINDHYRKPLRLTEIAEHFHFNPTYLSHYFSTHHHEGFSEYLNKLRIKKSMELLKNSAVSISDISGMVGYSDHSYYCKVFKKITGMSPSRYRKEYRASHEVHHQNTP